MKFLNAVTLNGRRYCCLVVPIDFLNEYLGSCAIRPFTISQGMLRYISWLFFKTSHFQITTPSAGQWVIFTLRKPQQQYWKCSLHYIVSTLIDQQQHSQLLPNEETIVSRLVRFRRFHQVRHNFGSATCRHFHTMDYTLFRSRDSHTMHSQPLGQDFIDNQKPKFVIRVEGWFDHI